MQGAAVTKLRGSVLYGVGGQCCASTDKKRSLSLSVCGTDADVRQGAAPIPKYSIMDIRRTGLGTDKRHDRFPDFVLSEDRAVAH